MVNLNKPKDGDPVISIVYVITKKPTMQALRIHGDLSLWLNITEVLGRVNKFGPMVVRQLPNEIKINIGENIQMTITNKTGPPAQPDLSIILDKVDGFSTQTTGLFGGFTLLFVVQ